VWSNGPETCTGGNVATYRASHARHVQGDDLDQKGYSGPSKTLIVETPNDERRLDKISVCN
jgi:hypothetical protein